MQILNANASIGSKVLSLFTGKDYYKTETGVKISCDRSMGYVQVDEEGKVYASGLQNAKIKGTNNDDDIHVVNSTVNNLSAKKGDDKITIENSDLDKIYGNQGRDLIHVVNSNVKNIDGGKGDDTVLAQDSHIEYVHGRSGKDTILTSGGTTDKVQQGVFFKDNIWISNNPINPEPSKYYQIGSLYENMPEVFGQFLSQNV